MNVLLINPNREQTPWPVVPIGLCLVATALRRAGHDVEVLDLTFSSDPRAETLRAMRRRQPELVGITVRNIDNCNFESPLFYLPEIRNTVVAAVREADDDVPIVIGGAAVNVAPWPVLHFLQADYAIVGEGEQAMPRFITALQEGSSVEQVQGVLMRGGRSNAIDEGPALGTDRRLRGEPASGRALVADLEHAARCEPWRWVELGRYTARGGSLSVQTKRGCALRCSYCAYNNIEGRTYRLRSVGDVADEIEEAVRDHGMQRVDFVDSTFNLPLAHALALCEELARRALPVELTTMGLNPAAVPRELLAAMKRAGFTSVMCTAESASNAMLRSLQKGYTRDQVVLSARNLRRAGLKTLWFFMFGAPGETIETVEETLAFCEEHIAADDLVLFTTGIRVLPGTPLEQHCRSVGWFAEDDPLLEPAWYISPSIELAELYPLVSAAARAHPNWMTNAETVIRPRLAAIMKRGFQLLGWQGPFWTHLPKLFGLTSKLGARQRLLDHNERRITARKKLHHIR